MSEETENEEVVLENLEKMPITGANPGGKHPHHGRDVQCKPGILDITLEPALDHSKRERYVRTADHDERGRAIFRMEHAG